MIWFWPALGTAAGLIFGSFIATLVVRWPRGQRLGGRSACDACMVQLEPRDLIPIVSFVLADGRCRQCGDRIDPVHPIVEACCGAIGFAALAISPDAAGVTAMLVGWLLVALAALDIREYWLPDLLTAALAMIAALSSWLVDPPGTLDRFLGGIAGFGSLWVIATLYRRLRGRDGLGGGDAKLLGALGLWLGWQPLPVLLVAASGLGLGVALLMMLRGKTVTGATRLPFGALLAAMALPVWAAMR